MDDDAAGFSGSIPAHYDSGLGPVIFRHYADVFGRAIAESRPRRILETAAGTGISSAAIVEHNPDAELVITDLNDGMLQFARQGSADDPGRGRGCAGPAVPRWELRRRGMSVWHHVRPGSGCRLP
ncbi:hypothetical protein [Leifsonia sp. 2MCAF36]|uniref:hypothetical protein n=1 Tax=Leifsonia sp. 2MCAF36 TaxID=3232988 RepID=UPI003F973A00